MARKVLVSLVSAQTIPNVQLIKEFDKSVDAFLFISTSGMEKSGNRQWIIDATGMPEEKVLQPIIVDAHSFDDIENSLAEAELSDDDEFIVNITGGTKVMSISIFEYFKNLKSEIYYITGSGNEYIKVFPGRRKQALQLQEFISLKEYLVSYGFELQKANNTLYKPIDFTKKFFQYFTTEISEDEKSILNELRNFRSKNLSTAKENIEGLEKFLNKIDFQPKKLEKLDKYECRYLSGDWFEEYIFNRVKSELELEDDKIGIGYSLVKQNVPNEFDVLFVYNNRIYTIECKTSIFDKDATTGIERSIIGSVIYKSDSLQKDFGLFANTSIFTLSPVVDEKGNLQKSLQTHYERAKQNRIPIASLLDIKERSIKEILRLK
ncbi:MAG: DUF1887 family protein [Bernardetiaceae bacterium]|nr:DUF1887 family protein [Bernardetiaceae bacterium]